MRDGLEPGILRRRVNSDTDALRLGNRRFPLRRSPALSGPAALGSLRDARGQTPRVHRRESLHGAGRGPHTRDLVAGATAAPRRDRTRRLAPPGPISCGDLVLVAGLVPARVEEGMTSDCDKIASCTSRSLEPRDRSRSVVATLWPRSLGGARSRRSRRSPRSRPIPAGWNRRGDEPEGAAGRAPGGAGRACRRTPRRPRCRTAARARQWTSRRTCHLRCGVVLCHGLDPLAATLVFEYSLHDGGLEGRPRSGGDILAANRGVSGPNGATTGGGLTFSRWYMNPARKSATSMKPRNCDTG